MTQTSTEATKATFKGHGKPETFIYFGAGVEAAAQGVLARMVPTALKGLMPVSVETGEELYRSHMGISTGGKFWAAQA